MCSSIDWKPCLNDQEIWHNTNKITDAFIDLTENHLPSKQKNISESNQNQLGNDIFPCISPH